jgi:hypothetical protein
MTTDPQEQEARLLQRIEEFRAANPEITEALSVMNMTMSDYLVAIDAMQGRQVFSASAQVEIPLQVQF